MSQSRRILLLRLGGACVLALCSLWAFRTLHASDAHRGDIWVGAREEHVAKTALQATFQPGASENYIIIDRSDAQDRSNRSVWLSISNCRINGLKPYEPSGREMPRDLDTNDDNFQRSYEVSFTTPRVTLRCVPTKEGAPTLISDVTRRQTVQFLDLPGNGEIPRIYIDPSKVDNPRWRYGQVNDGRAVIDRGGYNQTELEYDEPGATPGHEVLLLLLGVFLGMLGPLVMQILEGLLPTRRQRKSSVAIGT